MIPWLRDLVVGILYDEQKAQRFVAGGLFLAGEVLMGGGTVPGTGLVIPGLEWAYPAGPYLKVIALYLGAGGVLPSGTKPPKMTEMP